MPVERRAVEVWASWAELDRPRRIGVLHAIPTRGKEVSSFEHDVAWLEHPGAVSVDPALRLHRGVQYVAAGRANFGAFLDSSPDRWGRTLLVRREAQRAREAGRAARTLSEIDFLLGVYDGHRSGGLRYRIGEGPYLDDDAALASPPWTSLRELEQASLALEREGAEADPKYGKWLRMLIAPGRSLGGARPKASVVDPEGRLWIAKFPSAADTDDVGAWESVAHRLAERAGLDVPAARIERFGKRHHTFLSRRFDRRDDGGRIHFASAMTLLERSDGEEGASYLELAGVLIRDGARTAADLEELWRRIVFSICISNIDDHLRNHGFLLRAAGWALAPAYDLNPVAHGDGLHLNVSETDNAQDLSLCREVARHFRVKPARAEEILGEVAGAVRGWRLAAADVGLSRSEQDRMAPAFRVAEATVSAGPKRAAPGTVRRKT